MKLAPTTKPGIPSGILNGKEVDWRVANTVGLGSFSFAHPMELANDSK